MLLRDDEALGKRAGTIVRDQIGEAAAAKLGLVSKKTLEHARDYLRKGAGSAD